METFKQLNWAKRSLALVCAFLFALACACAAMQENAYADSADTIGVFTANVSASYENPDTGAIEDAGGQSSKAMGQSMIQGIVQPNALVEKDGSGKSLITVRLYQASELGDVKVSYDDSHSGNYSAPELAKAVKEDAGANMNDYQFAAPGENATLRFNVHVNPMGRDVNFFIKLSDLVEGNTANFNQTINVDELKANAAAKAQSGQASSSNNNVSTSGAPDFGMIIVIVVVAVVVIGIIAAFVVRSRKSK